MEQSVSDILRDLKVNTGIFEVYESRIFKAYRTDEQGAIQAVTVELLDGGPGAPGGRYQLMLCDERGRRVVGASHDNLQVAISLAGWSALDRKPEGRTNSS